MLDKLSVIQQFLAFLTRNGVALVLVLLIVSMVANVYQYKEAIRLNDSIQQISKESLEYERKRSEKLESLLDNLSNQKLNENPSPNRAHQ